jgi:sigma-B regulation protein RsbU (phosphoserine phosphatase)
VARAVRRGEVVGVRGPLLGVRSDPVYLDEEVLLGPGDALVLYTDGLTDQRGGGAAGPHELAAVAADAVGGGAQAVVAALEARATRSGPAADDLAILVVSVLPGGR